MAGDYVCSKGEIANHMYFVKKGFVEVIATDRKTVIAYLSEGSYFGEIGCLITGTRSTYVKAKTSCIFLSITKEELLKTLANFPEQLKFLKAVSR
jgi:CRP-like cAMP-binding protein